MMSMPILPNVPVQPSFRIGNRPCPTNMPPPAPTAVPLGERSVNVRAPVRAAAGREGENGKDRLSSTEQQQLLSEILLLESYTKYKTSATSKGATIEYLVCTAWGLSNNYICRLKKKAMAEDGSVSTVLPATPNKSASNNDEQGDVITNREFAKSVYTPENLFALNECRQKKDTSLDLQWTKSGYSQRHAIALDKI
jgi:hypothetical protein